MRGIIIIENVISLHCTHFIATGNVKCDPMAPGEPTEEVIARNLGKIEHWKELGFDTTGLEVLLKKDYRKFQKRRLEILSGQIRAEVSSRALSPAVKRPMTKEEGPHDAGKEQAPKARVKKVAVIDLGEKERESERERKRERKRKGRQKQTEPDKGGGRWIDSHTFPSRIEPEPGEELPPEAVLIGAPVREEGKEKRGAGIESAEPVAVSVVEEIPRSSNRSDAVLIGEPIRRPEPSENVVEGVILLDTEEEPELDDRYNYYDITEGDQDEDEDEEEEDNRDGRRRHPDKGSWKGYVFAVFVVVILLTVSVFIYKPDLLDRWKGGGGGTPAPDIFVIRPLNGSSYESGERITFEVSVDYEEEKIKKETWNFGDDGEEGDGRRVSHFYGSRDERPFKATYKLVTEKNEVFEESVTVYITPLTVVLPGKRDGMMGRYDLYSSVLFEDPDGIELFSGNTGDVSITRVDLAGKGTMDVGITVGDAEVEDGFLVKHDVFEESIDVTMGLDGNATVQYSYLGQKQVGKTELTGELTVQNKNHFDLSTVSMIKSETKDTLELFSKIDEKNPFVLTDEIVSYTELSETPINIDITQLRKNGTFRMGDAEPGGVGNLHYMWKIDEMDNIRGFPSLKIEVTLQEDLLSTYGITEHTITIWITDGRAFPMKFLVHAVQEEGGSRYSMELTGTLDPLSYSPGTRALSEYDCDNGFNSTHHHPGRADDVDPDLDGEFSEMRPAPRTGTIDSGLNGYSMDEAVSVISSDAAFNSYMARHPKAFCIGASCNESDGQVRWNVTFGEKGSTAGINYIVDDEGGKHSRSVEVEVNTYAFDIGEVISFNGAVRMFGKETEISNALFDNGEIDLSVVTVGSGAGLPALSVETFYTGSMNNLDFGFYLSKETTTSSGSETCTAVLNGMTGQILYLTDHRESAPELSAMDFL